MRFKNYIVRNMVYFVVAFISTIITITATHNWIFSHWLSQDEAHRLKSIDNLFNISIPSLVQKEFSGFTFISNTVYPDVAISFGLDKVFFDILKKSGLISNELIIGILDKSSAVRALSKKNVKLKSDLNEYHKRNGITQGFNAIGKYLVLVKGVKIMNMGQNQGYLVGIIPKVRFESILKNQYYSMVRDFRYLEPSVDFTFSGMKPSEKKQFLSANDSDFIRLDSIVVSTRFSCSQKKNASMSWTFVATSFFISSIFVAIFGIGLKKSMERPVNQLLRYIEIAKNESKINPEMPEDPIFRHIAITVRDLKSALRKSATFEGLARATQMLAHDVRKPFTMLHGTLDLIAMERNSEELRKIANEALPEVARAISIVNGMIADVIEVDSDAKTKTEPTSLEALIENTLVDYFNYYKKAIVYMRYDLKHSRKLLVDRLKVARVFANIIENAIQAMKGAGHLYFSSRDIVQDNMAYIEIGIRNTGSFINDEDQKLLFDAFFTKDKKGGTGLGLAIARKIVIAHEGKICCRSDRDTGTEFIFTLPASIESELHRPMVESAEYIRRHHSFLIKGTAAEIADEEQRLEAAIIRSAAGKNIKILIVEDEMLYQNVLIRQLEKNEQLKEVLDISVEKSGEGAIEKEKTTRFDVILVDVDLGHARMNGFETVKALRSQGADGVICVNSNRGALEYGKIALEYGAQSFLPKPMVREHLLKIIYSAVLRRISPQRKNCPLAFENSTQPS